MSGRRPPPLCDIASPTLRARVQGGAGVLAFSIRQPWAWATLHAGKDVENRSWPLPRKMVGRRVLIHASAGCTLDEYEHGALSIALTCQAFQRR